MIRGTRWLATAGVGAVLALGACSEPAPDAPLTLSLSVGRASAGEILGIVPYYRQVNGGVVPFRPVQVVLSGAATEQVPVTLDVGLCLRDPNRERGGLGCLVRLTLVLRSAQGSIVDSVDAGPYDAVPGAVVRTAPITLRGVGTVAVASPRDTLDRGQSVTVTAQVQDRRGSPLPGREVLFRSSAPAVATVSPLGGVVTALAPGPVTITAVVAADTLVKGSVSLLVRGVVSASIGADSVVLDPGQTATPGATFTAVGLVPTPRWLSDDPTVATVGPATGLITAVKGGRVMVRVRALEDPSVTDSMVVVVRGVVGVVVSPDTLVLDPDTDGPLAATVSVVGSSSTAVTWVSRQPAVATVDAAGLVTAQSPGRTRVVATAAADPTRRDSAVVLVRGVETFAVAPDTANLNPGQTVLPSVTIQVVGVSSGVVWQSANPAVATVAANGLITAVAPGVAVVRAAASADPFATDSVVVRVAGVVSVALSPDSAWVDVGQSATPALSVVAINASTGVLITSSNPAVATVSGGIITGVTPGRAVITAVSVADPTKRDSLPVNVLFNWTGPLRLVGNALPIPGGTNLTPSVANRVGAAWAYPKRSLAAGFTIQFEFTITGTGGALDAGGQPGGEGLAVVIQNADSAAIGSGGSGLGYAGIPSSLAIEFDLWQDPAVGDPGNNHVSVHTRGLLPNSAQQSASLATAAVPQSMSTGLTQDVTITYVSGVLQVTISSIPVLSVSVDLTNIGGQSILDANGRAWVGFTASTGLAFENHNVRFYTLP